MGAMLLLLAVLLPGAVSAQGVCVDDAQGYVAGLVRSCVSTALAIDRSSTLALHVCASRQGVHKCRKLLLPNASASAHLFLALQ